MTGTFPGIRALPARSGPRQWTSSGSLPGRRNGSSPCRLPCLSGTKPWSTWVAAAGSAREILGVAVDAIDFESDTLHVVQQLKLSRSKAVFAPPKGGKLRDVPLPGPVADALREHMKRFPPVEITLPWKVADGPPVTKRLIFTGPRGGHVWRTSLNEEVWKRALASAGVIPKRKPGESYAESRENGMHALRHFYASVLLDAGENIKALAEYLGPPTPA